MSKISSTGGTITHTATGLVHRCRAERYDTQDSTVHPDKKFDFSAFIKPVKLTSAPGRIIRFK
jgi:hypothetical protein